MAVMQKPTPGLFFLGTLVNYKTMRYIENEPTEVVLMPVDLRIRDGQYHVVSFRLPRSYFKEPFFLDTLSSRFGIASVDTEAYQEQSMLVRPLHFDETDSRVVYTPIEEFVSIHRRQTADVKTDHFIFHMSRCGSTLITQMLSTSARFFVLSEPPIINTLLDPSRDRLFPEGHNRMEILAAAINAMLDCKPATAEYAFIKFRSWNTLFMEAILEHFPDTGWFFVHRSAVEVLASVLAKPPGWLRCASAEDSPFAEVLGTLRPGRESIDQKQYAALLLGAFCQTALNTPSNRGCCIDYIDLPGKLPSILERRLSMNFSSEEREKLLSRASFYSKDVTGLTPFAPHSYDEYRLISPEEIEFVQRYVDQYRAQLKERKSCN